MHNVIKEETIMNLMATLSGIYDKLLVNNKMYLMKKSFNIKMEKGTLIA